MQNASWMKYMLESRFPGENINNLRYADDITLMAENKEELKRLDEGERGEWKNWLKTHIQKTMIMASDPITSWQIFEENVETASDFIFLHFKINAEVTEDMKLKDACPFGQQLWQTLTVY